MSSLSWFGHQSRFVGPTAGVWVIPVTGHLLSSLIVVIPFVVWGVEQGDDVIVERRRRSRDVGEAESHRTSHATPGYRMGTTRAPRRRRLPTKPCHVARPSVAIRAYRPGSSSNLPLSAKRWRDPPQSWC